MIDEEEPVTHLRRWISVGDVIVMASSLLVMGVMWGSISRDVDRLSDEVQLLRETARTVTPGAAQAIAAMQQKDVFQDQQIAELRSELRNQRAEILSALSRVENQLDEHDRNDR